MRGVERDFVGFAFSDLLGKVGIETTRADGRAGREGAAGRRKDRWLGSGRSNGSYHELGRTVGPCPGSLYPPMTSTGSFHHTIKETLLSLPTTLSFSLSLACDLQSDPIHSHPK